MIGTYVKIYDESRQEVTCRGFITSEFLGNVRGTWGINSVNVLSGRVIEDQTGLEEDYKKGLDRFSITNGSVMFALFKYVPLSTAEKINPAMLRQIAVVTAAAEVNKPDPSVELLCPEEFAQRSNDPRFSIPTGGCVKTIHF